MTKWQRIHLQCRRLKRHGFNPRIRKIPWRRKWQSTPVFLPGKFHGQRSLVGYSPWDCKELDTTEQLSMHAPRLDSSLASIDITGIPVCKSDKKTKRKKKKKLSCGIGSFYTPHLESFPCFHLKPQHYLLEILVSRPQIKTYLPWHGHSFVFSFPETRWFGVSIGYALYVKCSAILLSTLPPIAYNRCCLITFFFQSDCGTLRCVPVPGRIFTKQFWHWDQELHYPQHVQAYSDIYREFTEFSITFLWILCTS